MPQQPAWSTSSLYARHLPGCNVGGLVILQGSKLVVSMAVNAKIWADVNYMQGHARLDVCQEVIAHGSLGEHEHVVMTDVTDRPECC